ncbi:MAG: DUF5060 domain-containing protein [Sedimentisphaerales bacterium]|nr:DUF5060 domain-containing protein [Sedimentisphaerales bacterium]
MTRHRNKVFCLLASVLLVMMSLPVCGKELAKGGLYSVVELSFTGPEQGPKDAPARDVDFGVRFRHESGSPEYKIQGFWDGDGKGGTSGDVFKVRLCPTKVGRWNLVEVYSNQQKLRDQKQGDYITAIASAHPGFWIVNEESPGGRWYRRSDGSHPYIFGNTHYSFLSGYGPGDKASENDIAADIIGNADYFKKLRFSPYGDRYVHPNEKPFFDEDGRLSDSGDDCHRPNPRWFNQRVDLAVQTAWKHDLIADIILCGPDTEDSRAVLRAAHNDGDPEPYLKYIAARYGSFPNVWICLCNEYEIKKPKYTEKQIAHFGCIIKKHLPYPTPLSVHSTPRTLWSANFDDIASWNDHMIIQKKIRNLYDAADVIQTTRLKSGGGTRNMPTVNDELSYEGKGDKHSEKDTIESHFGIFLGGAYGTTGEKPGNKLGQYFRGCFDPAEHTAADNLRYLREIIDEHITFWKMSPDVSIFSNLHKHFRGLAWPGREYVLGTDKAYKGLIANLPDGTWTVYRYDIIKKQAKTLSENASGLFAFDATNSRAVMFHFKRIEEIK